VTVYPAIDLMGGVAVRLRRGDPAQRAQVGADPVAVARRWMAEGAEWLHVVDLDGAFAGGPRHTDVIGRICRAVDIPVQVGGGLRSLVHLTDVFNAGASRAVIGTAALDPQTLGPALREHGGRVAVALDVRDGHVAVSAWTETTPLPVVEAAARLQDAGVTRLVYTDINRDGMLSGPNLDGLRRLSAATSLPIILSGGIGRGDDVRAAAAAGADGVIVGRALYDGTLTLAGAHQAARGAG
jgi:phosphoribosylformimino-5-aminoimidazole carboxamide ribotide isomerase